MSQPCANVLNKMPSIFLLFVRRTENNVFWPTGWVGGRKKSVFFITDCVAKATMTFHFPAPCRANYFPGFPVKFSIFCLSSFHVYRQCSPVQIKYVSFADKFNSKNLPISAHTCGKVLIFKKITGTLTMNIFLEICRNLPYTSKN